MLLFPEGISSKTIHQRPFNGAYKAWSVNLGRVVNYCAATR